jgi:Phage tail sheath C-terminal domain
MANLVSAGVSVKITDESYFIPASASTVPLFFIATADEKKRPDGVTAAAGTFESNVIRTVTSLRQSTELYGVPKFLDDTAGNPLHGDTRNEYGLFALNQFLGVGNLAYVIRANVNLNDNLIDIRKMWDTKKQESAYVLENLVNAYLSEYNLTNGFIPSTVNAVNTLGAVAPGSLYTNGTYTNIPLTGGTGSGATANIVVVGGAVVTVALVNRGTGYGVGNSLTASAANLGGTGSGFTVAVATLTGYKQTVNKTVFLSLAATSTVPVWKLFSFQNSKASFTNDFTTSPKNVYANGYSAAATGTFLGLTGIANAWVAGALGSIVGAEWTAAEASSTLLGAGDSFKFTADFLNQTSLGTNDAARRVAVVTALQASINSNTDIRSETYEYNLILCPGFHEVADEMLNLRVDIQEEAMVIADVPLDKSPDDTPIWAATSARRTGNGVVYYYPHGLASNLDGKNVYIAASGIALRTMTYSDNVSELWFAPAGTRRGLVSGVSAVGYVTGTLGSATTFNEVALNQGQRDNLYKYFTNINPIVFFPGRGIIVWGQKTSAPDASARDRINVERLIQYIRRQLRKNTMSFIFEPNDQLTRDNLKAAVDGFLGDLIVKRGLYDFASICDTSNNTPDRIDRNEMYIDIALKPVKAAEFLYIPIRIVSTGAQI